MNSVKFKTTTPKSLTKVIQAFCQEISSIPPQFVPVRPVPEAIMDECFYNVASKVRVDGGEFVYGWIIWECSPIMIEAEHHAVWKSPAGDFVDITPKVERERSILFLPDPATTYDWKNNKRVDNKRKALVKDDLVYEFINNASTANKYINDKTVNLHVVSDMSDVYNLLVRNNEIFKELRKRYGKGNRDCDMLKLGRNSPCPCGSGKKFKHCHG